MATLQERIREYLGSQADTPAARNIAQQAEAGYGEALGAALGAPAMGVASGAVSGRGTTTPAEREYLNSVMNQTRQGPSANVPRVGENIANQVGSPEVRGAMGATNAMGAMGEAMTPPVVSNMGGMTPEQSQDYFQSFTDAGLNLTPGAGIARGLRGIDQAVTNATTAPGNLGVNQLSNIASGQSNVSPYGLGLGQQMYNPMGLLNF